MYLFRGKLKDASRFGNFFGALKTCWGPSAVVCSMVGLLSLWHIPHFHSQYYIILFILWISLFWVFLHLFGLIFDIALKRASHKARFNPLFFLKMSCSKSGILQLLSNSSCLCLWQGRLFIVALVLLFRCFLLKVDAFSSVCNPDFFSLDQFITFEQRYTLLPLFIRFRVGV